MNSERSIIEKLNENRRLKKMKEASFDANGSHYSSAFGNYTKDGEPISRDDYFKAKEGGSVNSKEDSSHENSEISKSLESMAKNLQNTKVNKYSDYDEIVADSGADDEFINNLSDSLYSSGYKLINYVGAKDSPDGCYEYTFANKGKPKGQRVIKVYQGPDDGDLNIIIDKDGYLEKNIKLSNSQEDNSDKESHNALGSKEGDTIKDSKTDKIGVVKKTGQSGNYNIIYADFGDGKLRKINPMQDAQTQGSYKRVTEEPTINKSLDVDDSKYEKVATRVYNNMKKGKYDISKEDSDYISGPEDIGIPELLSLEYGLEDGEDYQTTNDGNILIKNTSDPKWERVKKELNR